MDIFHKYVRKTKTFTETMKKKRNTVKTVKCAFFAMLTVLLLQACGSVPITGRRQLQLISDQEVLAMSLQQYSDFMRTAPVIRNTPNAQMVARVGNRVSNAVETFLKNNGYESELKNFAWEFNLVKNNQINAFCMPGGKIVVYEGLLPVTRDETGLAIVVGHEIAHAVAKHANERISQQLALKYGGAIAGGLLGNSQAMQQIGGAVFGLGAQFGVMMPYARKQEYEADELGLIFMAMAGYDPRAAVPFWTRMAQSSQGGSVPEFMSTHPSDANRIAAIEKMMPTILKYYKGANVQNNTSTPIKTKTSVPANTKNAKTSKDWSF